MQIYVFWFAASGPFVDEGLYTVAGMRVLEGEGLSDGYITWFNGSPFVWPVIAAALGHRLGGLPGARFVAAILSTVTLVAFARTAENLFGQTVAEWCALAFAVYIPGGSIPHWSGYRRALSRWGNRYTPVYEYERNTWGPSKVDRIVSPAGGWYDPIVTGESEVEPLS